MSALAGHFYAVGVGPGAPDLVTLRAARLIESADVIIVPRSENGQCSLAHETIRELLGAQEVMEHASPMTRDQEKTRACWAQMAEFVCERCGRGQSMVQVTIGDPMIYSTCAYLMELLSERLGGKRMHIVPGISAFQAAASRLGECLTLQEDRMTLMPATDLEAVECALKSCETLVLYKAGGCLNELRALLEKNGALKQANLVCYVEQDGKEVLRPMMEVAPDFKPGYMATLIVRMGRREWNASGTADQ